MACRRLVTIMLAAAVVTLFSASVCGSAITVLVDNCSVEYGDVEPMMSSGRLLVPLRATFEALDATVVWNHEDESVIATRDRTIVQMRLGDSEAKVNGVSSTLDVPPLLIDGRVLIPLRFVAEAFGDSVVYEGSAGVVRITRNLVKDPVVVAEQGSKSVVAIECWGQLAARSGSGIAVDNGVIITNFHVIEGMIGGDVIAGDGSRYEIIGVSAVDPVRDLAVIVVQADLVPARLGNSDEVKIGESVVAIGSPYGLHNTVSMGIISGLRIIDGMDYIQTSAPIAAGSSGGGLFNMEGAVVGITVARISGDGELNFAIPINEAIQLLAGQKEPIALADMWVEHRASTDVAVDWLREVGGVHAGDLFLEFMDVLVWEEADGTVLFCLLTDYDNGLVYEQMVSSGYKPAIGSFMREVLAGFEYLFPGQAVFGGITAVKYTAYYPHWASGDDVWFDEASGMWTSVSVVVTVDNLKGAANVTYYNW